MIQMCLFLLRKKKLIEQKMLTEKGKPNTETPKDWLEFYVDEKNNNIKWYS